MIHDNSGDMFKLQCQAYVNPVNTVGVAGKGLALTFKRQFPNNYEVYRKACFSKELTIGKVLLDNLGLANPQYIISFPTKEHWANFSKYEYIQSGLIALVNVVVMNNIQSVAIPALGCGLGGLHWLKVRTMIVQAFERFPQVEVYLCV